MQEQGRGWFDFNKYEVGFVLNGKGDKYAL